MAVDMFMDITEAPGESLGTGFTGKIDVLAWSWGMSNGGTTHMGGGGGAGKVNVQDLSFTKYVDKASPKLQLLCCNGHHLPKAILTVQKAGKVPIKYVVVTLEEILVTSVSMGGSGGEDRLTENVTLNFGKVKYEYTPQKADGSADVAVPYTWNVAHNAAT